MRRYLVGVLPFAILLASCGPKNAPATSRDRPVPEREAPKAPATVPRKARETVDRGDLTQALEQERKKTKALREELDDRETALAALEERFKALEIELQQTLEEVLRSKASLRSMQSRALATSQIAEVRVQMQAVTRREDSEVNDRLQRAGHFLMRADQALEEGNYGGAAYLAERASELVRQANTVSQFRQGASHGAPDMIPIVPPRSLEALVKANLREEPGTGAGRVGKLEKGQRVLALARLGSWFQVETEAGVKAWVHSSLVK